MILPPPIVLIHLQMIFPCIFLGPYLLLTQKGTLFHRQLGKIYMVLMACTGVLTLWIPAAFGPRIFNHFGILHLLSIVTLWSVPTAWLAIRKGDVKTHKSAMIKLYMGGIVLAGLFAVLGEGRYLNMLIFR